MASNPEYIERLRLAVERLHNCSARHSATVHVHEAFLRQAVWDGDVEIFDLQGHPEAKRCFGWSHPEDKGGAGERFITVLETPAVDSALKAVQFHIVRDFKSLKRD